MGSEHHPGSFFGITIWGTESYFEDNSLSIYNSTLPLEKWRIAFKKCDFHNDDTIDREAIPDVVQHLYWGRTPASEEMDDFMLNFDTDPSLGRLTWEEFQTGLNNFRQGAHRPEAKRTVTEFQSGVVQRDDLHTHKRMQVAPKQHLMHPITCSQEYGFLAEEVYAMNGSSNNKFRKCWTAIAQYGDCVDRNNQGRTIASEMSPSCKKTMHDEQGSTIMLL